MATTKSSGTTRLGRDSESKRLGVKIHDGEKADAGNVIIKQRGSKYLPGDNVKKGDDDTLYAAKEGVVKFSSKTKTRFDGNTRKVKVVKVVQED